MTVFTGVPMLMKGGVIMVPSVCRKRVDSYLINQKALTYWHEMVLERILKHYDHKSNVAVVGKYVELRSYISITKH